MPTLSVTSPGIISEGNSGTASAVFTLTLSAPANSPVTLSYTTEGGSAPANAATAGGDYTATSGTLTIDAGQTTATIMVPVLGDATVEGDEVISLTLQNISGADLVPEITGPITATLQNDDAAPANQAPALAGALPDLAATEGAAFSYTVPADAFADPEAGALTFSATLADGSALPSWLAFNAATRTFQGTPPAGGGDLTVRVTATDAGGLGVFDDIALATPALPPTVTLARLGNTTVTEGNSGATDVPFQVRLSRAAAADVTVSYGIYTYVTNSVNAADFTATTGTVTIPAGQTAADFNLGVVGDTAYEPTETFQVRLTGVTGGSAALSDAGTSLDSHIQNDDLAPPAVTLARTGGSSITEGDSGNTAVPFQVRLSRAATADVTVSYTIGGSGSNAAGSGDFTATTGTVTIPAGQTAADFSIGIAGDTTYEPNEGFQIQLTGATGGSATLSDSETSWSGSISNDDQAPPTVSLVRTGDASIDEGDSGSTAVTFQARLSRAVSTDVTVNYTVGGSGSGSSAAGSGDFTATTGTVTIPAGQTTADFSIGIAGDTAHESHENYQVRLTTVSGAPQVVLAGDDTAQATGTIHNDDSTPSAVTLDRVGSYYIVEGNRGISNAPFQVNLNQAADSDITVSYSIIGTGSDSYAASAADFTATTGTVTIPAGQTTTDFSVGIVGDTAIEQTEYFQIQLTGVTGGPGVLGSSYYLYDDAAIQNDDRPAAAVSLSRIGGYYIPEGDSGTADATFRLTLSRAADTDVVVGYSITGTGSDSYAARAADFTATTGTVTIPAGQTTTDFTVGIVGDTLSEENEGFQVQLSRVTSGPAILASYNTYETAYIKNDDRAPPAVTLARVSGHYITEGSSGTTDATFRLTLSQAADTDVVVGYSITGTGSDSNAASADDFTATTGTVTIPAGQTTTDFTIGIAGDTVYEPTEGYRVQLSRIVSGTASLASNYTSETVYIQNDDMEAPTVSLTRTGGTAVHEGNGDTTDLPFQVQLSRALTSDITVAYTLSSIGTKPATAADFTATTGTVTILAGETSADLDVGIVGDTITEPNETYRVRLTGVTDGPASLATSGIQLSGTITNDDLSPRLVVSDVTVDEDDGMAVFTVRRAGSSRLVSSVRYTTEDGTAEAGSDFTAVSGSLSFAVGQMSKPIRVPLLNDGTREPTESFTLVFSDTVGLNSDEASVTATIRDNDVVPPRRDDFTANRTTRGTLTLGHEQTGWIGQIDDADWFRVSLLAGTGYVISAGPTEESYLGALCIRVRDSLGRILTTLPVTADEEDPYIFTPTRKGTFYLSVEEDVGSNIGQYTVMIETAPEDEDTASARARPAADLAAAMREMPLSGASATLTATGASAAATSALLAAV
ncbi:Calx-beta domain-containing protein [Azospirillum sp.]|uniref:Calx-beta domain-containing protein n=1 Tax=Azospirillum sp. TaxID=34012 RepID=UPI002D62E1F6|nr:Calx-beta domain-containing protein [Azospirillum sp.]HYD64528.1 Calx-beta domain-containing protein [Azospirillum sp.]